MCILQFYLKKFYGLKENRMKNFHNLFKRELWPGDFHGDLD